MKQITNLFLPNFKSMRAVFYEVANTSISRERFIDFTKIIGLLFLMINSFTLLRLKNSGGELFVSNLSVAKKKSRKKVGNKWPGRTSF